MQTRRLADLYPHNNRAVLLLFTLLLAFVNNCFAENQKLMASIPTEMPSTAITWTDAELAYLKNHYVC